MRAAARAEDALNLLLPATVFVDDTAPQRAALASVALPDDVGVLRRRGDHHHELQLGIDKDRLPVDAEQREAALLAGEGPELVAIAEVRRRLLRPERIRLAVPVGGIQQIVPGDDLLAAEGAVIGEQDAKAAIVAQRRIEPAEPLLSAIGAAHPCRIPIPRPSAATAAASDIGSASFPSLRGAAPSAPRSRWRHSGSARPARFPWYQTPSALR